MRRARLDTHGADSQKSEEGWEEHLSGMMGVLMCCFGTLPGEDDLNCCESF